MTMMWSAQSTRPTHLFYFSFFSSLSHAQHTLPLSRTKRMSPKSTHSHVYVSDLFRIRTTGISWIWICICSSPNNRQNGNKWSNWTNLAPIIRSTILFIIIIYALIFLPMATSEQRRNSFPRGASSNRGHVCVLSLFVAANSSVSRLYISMFHSVFHFSFFLFDFSLCHSITIGACTGCVNGDMDHVGCGRVRS